MKICGDPSGTPQVPLDIFFMLVVIPAVLLTAHLNRDYGIPQIIK